MPRVKCIKCGRIGNLTIKKTKSHGTTYEYHYVQHYIRETNKIEWCYLGSHRKLPAQYKRLLHGNPNYAQIIYNNTQQIRNNADLFELGLPAFPASRGRRPH